MEVKISTGDPLKLLLIGDSGTGKSSILWRFVNNQFLGDNSQAATIGIDFKAITIPVNGQQVRLNIWDTAGQEKFASLTTAYYRGAHGVILVYNVTSSDSFNNLAKWVSRLKDHINEQHSVLMVVGNQTDREAERQVSREDGSKYAMLIGALFVESSAKSGDGVSQAFTELVQKILESSELIHESKSTLHVTDDNFGPTTCSC